MLPVTRCERAAAALLPCRMLHDMVSQGSRAVHAGAGAIVHQGETGTPQAGRAGTNGLGAHHTF